MTPSNLLDAVNEAKRFIKRAEFLIAVSDCQHPNYGRMDVDIYIFPKEQGSVKRASMDLTRQLSKLRNGK